MGCQIIQVDDAILFIKLTGVMKLADQQALHTAGKALIAQGKRVRLYVALEDFQGWDKDQDWSDVGFLIAYGDNVAKIAFVGDEHWKDQAFAFVGKGLRTTQVEFYPASMSKEAENWIRS